MKRLAIIGAGLSGLYAAYTLKDRFDITVFEARGRLGGRVHTVDGFDMGPSWVWAHQQKILSLIRSLGLELFAQHEKGLALYETPQGVQRFQPPPSSPSGRVKGGVKRLIDALARTLNPESIHLNEPVLALCCRDVGIDLETAEGTYRFDYVLSTLPPRVAASAMTYDPPLAAHLRSQLEQTPTWMGHSAKCVMEFATPFWREMGLSGFCFSHCGPLGEIHDACTPEKAALFGFVNTHADTEQIEADVEAQLQRLFGEAAAFLSFYCVDWRKERYSATPADAAPRRAHPDYGLSLSHFDDRLFFIGTETAYSEGGYLEGALVSVDQVEERLLSGHGASE